MVSPYTLSRDLFPCQRGMGRQLSLQVTLGAPKSTAIGVAREDSFPASGESVPKLSEHRHHERTSVLGFSCPSPAPLGAVIHPRLPDPGLSK